jgi:hypothetical protein
MNTAYSPQSESPEPNEAPPGRRTPTRGTFLFFAGVVVAALGVLGQGWLEVSFFGHSSGPFVEAYRSFEWGQSYSTILVGAGILLAGIGWTFEQRARERRRYPTPGTSGSTSAKVGVLLVLLGAVTLTLGQFLTAGLMILGLEGDYSLANALGPGLAAGEYDILGGAGLLIAAAGVFLLTLTGRLAFPGGEP